MNELPFQNCQECQRVVILRGALLARPEAIDRPRRPCATGFPNGLFRASSWLTWMGLKSPESPAKPTTSASVTVRPGLSPLVAENQVIKEKDQIGMPRHGNRP